MGASVKQYEVVRECYVPIGQGLRYKRPGNVVTLGDKDAGKLASYIKPLESEKPKRGRVAKRNTKPEVVEQPAADVGEGVNAGDGDKTASDERDLHGVGQDEAGSH